VPEKGGNSLAARSKHSKFGATEAYIFSNLDRGPEVEGKKRNEGGKMDNVGKLKKKRSEVLFVGPLILRKKKQVAVGL